MKRLPELTRAAMWVTALVIAVLTAGAVTLLWWPVTAGLTGADLVKARLDALKIGLSIGVGSGGVVALYLAWRRQHSTEADLDNRERALSHQQAVAVATQEHQERVADEVRADALERRITELYTKAVEQLGSDRAPVRLGGLYALERLAQNRAQRQTVVNILCAYLRMPYQAPDQPADDASADRLKQHREQIQEREVRLTAQRLLKDHLTPGDNATYWGSRDLDLTGAQLINFDLSGARIGTASFDGATFLGSATSFDRATFVGNARFRRATFTTEAHFRDVTFIGSAVFGDATFADEAVFLKTTFTGNAWFGNATFGSDAWFRGATFSGDALFGEMAFTGDAIFDQVTFTADAVFYEAAFASEVWFRGATFAADAVFDKATRGDASFRPPEAGTGARKNPALTAKVAFGKTIS